MVKSNHSKVKYDISVGPPLKIASQGGGASFLLKPPFLLGIPSCHASHLDAIATGFVEGLSRLNVGLQLFIFHLCEGDQRLLLSERVTFGLPQG